MLPSSHRGANGEKMKTSQGRTRCSHRARAVHEGACPGRCPPRPRAWTEGSQGHGLRSPASPCGEGTRGRPDCPLPCGQSSWQCRAWGPGTRGLRTSPNSLFQLKFSGRALRVRRVFLDISAKAIQTLPKMRLGKKKAALPKLSVFPALPELPEELMDLAALSWNRSAALGHPSLGTWLLVPANTRPKLGELPAPLSCQPRSSVCAAGCQGPLARNSHCRRRDQEMMEAAWPRAPTHCRSRGTLAGGHRATSRG